MQGNLYSLGLIGKDYKVRAATLFIKKINKKRLKKRMISTSSSVTFAGTIHGHSTTGFNSGKNYGLAGVIFDSGSSFGA
jgi:hypothetical protein